MCTGLAEKRSSHRIPVDIHPRKLSFSDSSLDDRWEEHHPVVPIVSFPGGQEGIVEIRMLEIPNEIVPADHIPVRL